MNPSATLILFFTLTRQLASPLINQKIHRNLAERLEKFPNSLNDVVVSFRDDEEDIKKAKAVAFRAAAANTSAYDIKIAAFQAQMAIAQAGATAMLTQAKARRSSGSPPFKSMNRYWISNQMYLKQASKDIIVALALDPKVAKINLEGTTKLRTVRNKTSRRRAGTSARFRSKSGLEWHLEAMNVKDAWDLLGHKGTGVRIGIIDTGVRVTYETLKDNYLGKYGWFDPTNTSPTQDDKPKDYVGHGTAVASMAVGAAGVGQLLGGVASDAKWMACAYCRETAGCEDDPTVACLEFMACPTLPDKTQKKCDEHPHIVNLSFGKDPGVDFDAFSGLKKLKELGVIVLAAAGNQGPFCNTGNYPSELPDIISVGAIQENPTTGNYEFASFSSVGPFFQKDTLIKPDITAPGEDVAVADFKGDTFYRIEDGTSFSTPLAAGVVALLLSKKPGLTTKQVLAVLTKTADTDIDIKNPCCGHYDKRTIPNNFIGHALINAHKPLQSV